VNTYTTGHQATPAIAADGAGNFVVVWQSIDAQDGEDDGIFAQRYDTAGNALGGEFQVNTYTTNSQDDPAVAADGAGNFMVVWRSTAYFEPSQDGRFSGVFGQQYDSAGMPVGGERRGNAFWRHAEGYPSVAPSGAGDFILTWHGANHDAYYTDIFGQRFDAAGRQSVVGRLARLANPSTGVRRVEVVGVESPSNSTVSGDPLTYGALVEVIAHGDSDQNQTFNLPPGASAPGLPGWKQTASGWKYSDRTGVNGPVRRAAFRNTARARFHVSVLIQGTSSSPSPGVSLIPPGNGTDVGFIFTVLGPQGGAYCVNLGGPDGGTITRDTASSFVVRNAATETSCPVP
jgi:hypothetical protein